VNEYWIVLPEYKIVEIFVLKDEYELHGHFVAPDKITAVTIPNVTIDLAEVFPSEEWKLNLL